MGQDPITLIISLVEAFFLPAVDALCAPACG